MPMRKDEKDIVWLGDSLSVLQAFPKSVRIDLGSDLRRLQIGELPKDFKPMKTVARGSVSCVHAIETINIERCT